MEIVAHTVRLHQIPSRDLANHFGDQQILGGAFSALAKAANHSTTATVSGEPSRALS